eukprot:3132397-Prymnesium_polylepis.1
MPRLLRRLGYRAAMGVGCWVGALTLSLIPLTSLLGGAAAYASGALYAGFSCACLASFTAICAEMNDAIRPFSARAGAVNGVVATVEVRARRVASKASPRKRLAIAPPTPV